jgi:hypothetical protein
VVRMASAVYGTSRGASSPLCTASVLSITCISIYCWHKLDVGGGSNFGQRRPMGPDSPPSGPSRGGSNSLHREKVAVDNVRQSDVAAKLTLPLLKDGRE